MIVQGSNLPLILQFKNGNVSEFIFFTATLYYMNSGTKTTIKTWTKTSGIIEKSEIQLPLTQQDTINTFPTLNKDLPVYLQVDWMHGGLKKSETFNLTLAYRLNHTILT